MKTFSNLIVLASFTTFFVEATPTANIIGDACADLDRLLPGEVLYPGSTEYDVSAHYWSNQQSETQPRCFLTPRSTYDVSTAIKVLTQHGAPFNVKGGGHNALSGASSIAEGITIDLLRMDNITLFDDKKTVSVGPGNRWGHVADVLDPHNLVVIGGRAADVGVPGFLLGGGISYFSNSYGWGCDNVRNYEIVLVSGEIVNASPSENTDLYWALRGGGGSDFGVVTRFDLAVFEQGLVWKNDLIFPPSMNETLLEMYQNFTVNGLPEDPKTHSYLGFTHIESMGGYIASISFLHETHATSAQAFQTVPSIVEPFQSLPSAVVNTTIAENTGYHLRSLAIPEGFRQTWANTFVRANLSPELIAEIFGLWEQRNLALWAAGSGSITPNLLFQSVPVTTLTQMQQNGGNALGLYPADGARLLVSIPVTWESSADDQIIEASTQKLIADIRDAALKYGSYDPYVYMNYAEYGQKVQASYGEKNYAELRRVAKKVDPTGELRRLWAGHFKLDG